MFAFTRRQLATLWRTTGTDKYGSPLFSAPITTMVRWETRARLVTTQAGEEIVSEAEVWTDYFLAVSNGDWVAKGDQTANASPLSLTGAREVKDIIEIPMLLGGGGEKRLVL